METMWIKKSESSHAYISDVIRIYMYCAIVCTIKIVSPIFRKSFLLTLTSSRSHLFLLLYGADGPASVSSIAVVIAIKAAQLGNILPRFDFNMALRRLGLLHLI